MSSFQIPCRITFHVLQGPKKEEVKVESQPTRKLKGGIPKHQDYEYFGFYC